MKYFADLVLNTICKDDMIICGNYFAIMVCLAITHVKNGFTVPKCSPSAQNIGEVRLCKFRFQKRDCFIYEHVVFFIDSAGQLSSSQIDKRDAVIKMMVGTSVISPSLYDVDAVMVLDYLNLSSSRQVQEDFWNEWGLLGQWGGMLYSVMWEEVSWETKLFEHQLLDIL